MITIEDLAIYCKKKGFVYKSSDIYGGLSGVHDWGPLGVELKRAVSASWWKRFVTTRDDMVGIDGAIISAADVWKASGHADNFNDPLVTDTKTGKVHRADQLIEDALGITCEGKSIQELQTIITEHTLLSPEGNALTPITTFNQMFPLTMGTIRGEPNAYLRGETAQIIFTNYKNIIDTGRVSLPFGIAQVGKAFRNEISPREFLFRQREFEQLEIEYFHTPELPVDITTLPDPSLDYAIAYLCATAQTDGTSEIRTTLASLVQEGSLSALHAYWLKQSHAWYVSLGINPDKLRVREHLPAELSHYSQATFDIEYHFPFGWKEIFGIADRSDYDLSQHEKHSGKNLRIHDETLKKSVLAHVIEPSFGLDRAILALLVDAYDPQSREHIVLKLASHIAPVQVAILPLVKNKETIYTTARTIYARLLEAGMRVQFDSSGSIGRRYARQDEIGTPWCVTIDYDTIEDGTITLRARDSAEQIRVHHNELERELWKHR